MLWLEPVTPGMRARPRPASSALGVFWTRLPGDSPDHVSLERLVVGFSRGLRCDLPILKGHSINRARCPSAMERDSRVLHLRARVCRC